MLLAGGWIIFPSLDIYKVVSINNFFLYISNKTILFLILTIYSAVPYIKLFLPDRNLIRGHRGNLVI